MGGFRWRTALPFVRWPGKGIYGWHVTCCEVGFGAEEDIEELATLNPAKTITRLRRELRSAAAADRLLIRPEKVGPYAEPLPGSRSQETLFPTGTVNGVLLDAFFTYAQQR